MSITEIPEIWKSLRAPTPGGSAYACTDGRIYNFHLFEPFNKMNKKLVTDSCGDRETGKNGDLFLEDCLSLNGGGILTSEGRADANILMCLYGDGYLRMEISSREDDFHRPDMTGKVHVTSSYGGSAEFVQNITKFLLESTVRPESSGNVYAMLSGPDGPEFKSIGHGGETLVRENYSEDVLKNYDRIVETLQAKIPPGRINILSGPPGTGKTFLVRGLIQEVRKSKFAIVQASMIGAMAGPSMLPSLLDFRSNKQPIVFVIEDAEECLATRDANNNSAVSALLNMGDGVLGSLIDIRIIATTNSSVKDLDPAIRRPGRLSTICEVGPLTIEQSAVIFTRLTGKEVFPGSNASYTIAEVYQLATDSGWKGDTVKVSKTMGFSVGPSTTSSHARLRRIFEEDQGE